jgi:hypothetical protein
MSRRQNFFFPAQPVRPFVMPRIRETWFLEWADEMEQMAVVVLMRIFGDMWQGPPEVRDDFEQDLGLMLKISLDLEMVRLLIPLCFICLESRRCALLLTLPLFPPFEIRLNSGISRSCS